MKRKNAKFSQQKNFAKIRNAKISWIKKFPVLYLLQLIVQKKIVKFSALTAQYLKFIFHIKNFSSFTLINVWWRKFDFSTYIFKFLSVHIRSPTTMSQPITRNFRSFRNIFFATFSHLGEILWKKQKGEKTRKFYFRERCENI